MAPTPMKFKIACIADLDKDAIGEDGTKTWKSLLLRGELTFDGESSIDVDFDESEDNKVEVASKFNYGGRGMELSDLLKYNGELYTVCDKTGIVYKITNSGDMIPWVILSSGDGKQADGFKGEWMTVKDGLMYIGGHGKELTRGDKVLNHDYLWIKTITEEGAVKHYNWEDNFNAMRAAAGCSFPGYLTHESGEWSDHQQAWFFLPRKSSPDAYDHKKDETMGTNMLIKCSEDFSNVEVIRVGELTDRKRGFSSFKFLPGSNDEIIVAIRSEEVDDQCRTHITAFKIDGTVLMEDKLISENAKYEGIEFTCTEHR